ncbi:SCO family protein [Candidatus Thioglobus sp.]|nr:SCO family protein [Candidatus Thioglobus sp.]MDC0920422.1 SCO family protein [Candidatus Thioglobus sp.]MDC0965695.1 SCO family protein [Candidatus Thioglobus sp.]
MITPNKTKTRNTSIALTLGLGLIVTVYFLLMPGADQFNELKKQVVPTVSLYSNPKALDVNLELLNDSKSLKLSEVVNNKWSILYFGYTSCPDVCPTDLAVLNQTIRNMNLADKLQVIFISVDPARDIGKLQNFVERFNADFIGLSAKDAELRKLTKALGIYHEVAQTKQRAAQDHSSHEPKEGKMKMSMPSEKSHDHSMEVAQPANNYLIDHTASYLLLNPDLELIGLLTNPHNASKMAPALDLIIETLD